MFLVMVFAHSSPEILASFLFIWNSSVSVKDINPWFISLFSSSSLLPLIWVCMLSHFSHVLLLATPWTVAHQAPLSMGLFRQEYCSGLPFSPPGDLPDLGIKPMSPVCCTGRWVLYHLSSPSLIWYLTFNLINIVFDIWECVQIINLLNTVLQCADADDTCTSFVTFLVLPTNSHPLDR